jgi:hypothetical protein
LLAPPASSLSKITFAAPFAAICYVISVLAFDGCVSLRRSAKRKGLSVTYCVPTSVRTAVRLIKRCNRRAVINPSPCEDIFVVIHPKWIRLSIDLARIVKDFCMDSGGREGRKDYCGYEFGHLVYP